MPVHPDDAITREKAEDIAATQWKLVVEATMFVTYATVVVWSGVKAGGNDPTGTYTRLAGCDPTAAFTAETAL